MVSKPQAPASSPPGGDTTTDVLVPLGSRSYPIRISSGAWDASRITSMVGETTHWLVVGDEAVRERWTDPLTGQLAAAGGRVDSLTIASGETSKSIGSLDRVWEWMLDCGADRQSVLVAVGGGVVGDLAGFAAATFARGIRFVQVPTTLLAMVDSSVGGKTGINLPRAKNMVGSFWQPECVMIDTEVLSTLPDRIYRSGLAEVIKYGVIDDAEFFVWLEGNASALVGRDAAAVRHAVVESCRSKSRVVQEDERETSGRRAILNYGHTFAHAIEATAGYGTLLHGEAVAIGMQMAARLAIDMELVGDDLLTRQTALVRACQLPTEYPDADVEAMLDVMRRDKKVAHGKLRFVLPTAIGSVRLVGDVQQDKVREAIRGGRS